MSRVLLPVIVSLFASSGVAQTCSIDGSVLNSLTKVPVLRAHVTVTGSDNNNWPAGTDAAGKWRIENLACGRVTVSSTRPGFLKAPVSPSILLIASTPLHDVKLELAPQAVLTGRVLDDQGDPFQGAQVSLMTTRIINGLRGVQASNSMMTNDLGEYRFAGLAAGRYFVCANGAPNLVSNGSAPIGERCYPGPIDAGAVGAMDIRAGTEGRVDFTLTPLTSFRVNGVVSGFPEQTSGLVTLTLRKSSARMFGLNTPVHPDGTFSFRGVAPGEYYISARAGQLTTRLMARVPVDVGGNDVNGIQLHLETGVSITGSLKVESPSGKKPERPQYTLLLRGRDGPVGPGTSGWDETKTSFTVDDVMPGNYRLEFSPPPPFYLKSATLNGRDMVASEVVIGPGAQIEVVISDDSGTVEGEVSSNDAPVTAWVFLERNGVPSRNASTDSRGHFKIGGLPPGEYKVYSWEDNARVEYANPEWMRQNGKGVVVSVGAGQTAQVTLVRQGAPPE